MEPDPLWQEQRALITASLLVLAAVATTFALTWASAVAVPLVLAILLVIVVDPLVDVLQGRLNAPRWLASVAAFVVIGVGVALGTLLIWSSVVSLTENVDLYRERFTALGVSALGWLETLPPELRPDGLSADQLDVSAVLAHVDREAILTTLGAGASNVVGVLTHLAADGAMVVLFSMILLSSPQRPPTGAPGLRERLRHDIQRYFTTKAALSAVTGVVTWLVLWLLGVDMAVLFGTLAFALNFIPNLGSVVSVLLPLPVAMAQFDAPWMWGLTLALPTAAHMVIGNVIEPQLMGDDLDLHPITILLALVFWSLVWGIVGAFVSVPLTAVMKVALEQHQTTRPIAELLAGRVDAASRVA